MTNVLLDALATAESEIGIVEVSSSDLRYGSDLACRDDVTESWAERDGGDIELVKEMAYRRLRTPKGSLEDDPEFGWDVAQILHTGRTLVELMAYQDIIAGEVADDDRLKSCKATLTIQSEEQIDLRLDCVLAATNERFSMTMVISDGPTVVEALYADR